MSKIEYWTDRASRNMSMKNGIMIVVVGMYLTALWMGMQSVVDALSVPAGIAIGWGVQREDTVPPLAP